MGVADFMMKVRLEVAQGDFVATVYMLPFDELPKVVVWGSRVFELHDDGDAELWRQQEEGFDAKRAEPVYRETFCVAVFEEKMLSQMTGGG